MPKYMFKASYTREGIQGLMKEGGSSRREVVGKMTASVGGSVEDVYFAFGDTDVYVIIDAPDDVSAAAVSMTVGAAGAVSVETVKLLTPEDIDDAVKKSVDYRPPGA